MRNRPVAQPAGRFLLYQEWTDERVMQSSRPPEEQKLLPHPCSLAPPVPSRTGAATVPASMHELAVGDIRQL